MSYQERMIWGQSLGSAIRGRGRRKGGTGKGFAYLNVLGTLIRDQGEGGRFCRKSDGRGEFLRLQKRGVG